MSKSQKKRLMEENNQLREELNKENRIYYERLLSYMRLGSIFHDSSELEELLLEILQDILEAQASGLSAVDFFGHGAKVAADECLSRIEMKKSEGIKLFGLIFIGSLWFTSVRGLMDPMQGINLISIIAQFLLHLSGVSLFFYWIKKSIYKKTFMSNDSLATFVITIVMMGMVFSVAFIEYFSPMSLSVYPSPVVSVGLLFASSILVTVKVLSLTSDERIEWISLVPIPWVYATISMLNHWPQTADWMHMHQLWISWIPLVVIGICAITNVLVIRKREPSDVKFFQQ